MTNDEIEKTLIRVTNALETLVEQNADFKDSLTRFEKQAEEDRKAIRTLTEEAAADRKEMRETVNKLTEIATGMALQADADRAEMRSVGVTLRESNAAMSSRMDRFEKQAEVDRKAVNEHMDRFEKQAEADRTEIRSIGSELRNFAAEMKGFAAGVTDAIRQMAQAQTNINARVTKLEAQKPQP